MLVQMKRAICDDGALDNNITMRITFLEYHGEVRHVIYAENCTYAEVESERVAAFFFE